MLVAHQSGHPIHLDRLVLERFLAAMIESFQGREDSLAAEIRSFL